MLVAMVGLLASSAQADVIYPTDDCWIIQKTPDHNDSTQLRAGWDYRSNMRINRGLLKFTMPTTPGGETISSVKFYLYLGSTHAGPGTDVYLSKVTANGSNWSESTATWNNTNQPPDATGTPHWTYSTISTNTVTFTSGSTTGQYYEWNIDTSMLSSEETITFAVRGPETGGSGSSDHRFVIFSTKETVGGTTQDPYMDITYTPEPATMALLGMGGIALLIRRKRRA